MQFFKMSLINYKKNMKLHFRLYNDAKKPIFAFKIIDRKKGKLRFNAYTINLKK